MTELTCWPLDNKDYTAEALGAAYAARSRGLLHPADFAAAVNGDNTLTIGPGVGCIHPSDYWAAFPYLLTNTLLEFEDADGSYPRWDAVALTYDKNNNTAGLTVRTGLAEASPALPAVRRDESYDEIFLYRVTRPKGATKISADNVVDLRLDEQYCGLMRDTIDSVDTGVMNAAFTAFLAQIEAELAQLHEGTAVMTKAEYDPDGKGENVYTYAEEAARKVSGKYIATLLLDGWTDAGDEDKAQGYLYTQTVAIVPKEEGLPAVTADSIFESPVDYTPTRVAATDDVLDEVLAIVNDGITWSGDGVITTIVKEKPTADFPAEWVIKA